MIPFNCQIFVFIPFKCQLFVFTNYSNLPVFFNYQTFQFSPYRAVDVLHVQTRGEATQILWEQNQQVNEVISFKENNIFTDNVKYTKMASFSWRPKTPLLNFEIQFGNTSNFLSNHNKYTCYQLDNNKSHIKPIWLEITWGNWLVNAGTSEISGSR